MNDRYSNQELILETLDFINIFKLQQCILNGFQQFNSNSSQKTHSQLKKDTFKQTSFIHFKNQVLSKAQDHSNENLSKIYHSKRKLSEQHSRFESEKVLTFPNENYNGNYEQKSDVKKVKKKETEIKKKKLGKFQKCTNNSSSKLNISQLAQGLPSATDSYERINIKMLLNPGHSRGETQFNFSPAQSIKNNSFSASQKNKSHSYFKSRSYSPLTPEARRQTSKFTLSPSSPIQMINQLQSSQQIQTVRHRGGYWPALNKKTDYIQKMEQMRASRNDLQYQTNSIKKAQIERRMMFAKQKQEEKAQTEQLSLQEMYMKGIGNKYIEKIVENYKKKVHN